MIYIRNCDDIIISSIKFMLHQRADSQRNAHAFAATRIRSIVERVLLHILLLQLRVSALRFGLHHPVQQNHASLNSYYYCCGLLLAPVAEGVFPPFFEDVLGVDLLF